MNKTFILSVLLVAFSSASIGSQELPDALALYKSGEYEEAVETCLAELEIQSRNVESYVVLGWSLIELDRYDEAIEYTSRALSISRYDHRLIHNMSEANFYRGNNEEALKYLEEYAAIAPTGRFINEVYYLMGEIFLRYGEFHHADIAFSTALYYSPNIANWWSRLGFARERAGDLNHALDAYQKALQLNPSLRDADRGRERVEALMVSG